METKLLGSKESESWKESLYLEFSKATTGKTKEVESWLESSNWFPTSRRDIFTFSENSSFLASVPENIQVKKTRIVAIPYK